MLHDGQFSDNLALVHAGEAGGDSTPIAQAGDVVEHRRVLAKVALFHRAHEVDGSEVKEVITLRAKMRESGSELRTRGRVLAARMWHVTCGM